jgi:hypothetical protein
MNFNDPETKRKVKNLANRSLKSKPSWLFPPENTERNFDPKSQIGPLNTPTGYPEPEIETKPEPKPKTILNKIGSSIKKYIPLKKFMKENCCYPNIQQ